MDVTRIDPRDSDAFAAWFEVLHRSEVLRDHGRDEGWRAQEWRARALDETGSSYHQLFSFGDDELHPVAVGALEVTLIDNLRWIRGDLFVDPAFRRRGHGTALLRHLEQIARELNRSTLLFWVLEDASEHGAGPNRHFAPRHGYDVVEENIQRDLDWPRPRGELDRLWTTWRPHALDYAILSWRGTTPAPLLAGRAHLSAIMPIEVPDTGIGLEEEQWDDERVREHELRTDQMGRDLLVAAAQHRVSGEVVGFSELTVSRERPETAHQWDTLVVRAHRGHRLGGLMKIATMRLLDESNYATRTITTFNSSQNAAMIAVNVALGTRVTGDVVNWRKILD